MSDLPRLNGIIKQLEEGNQAFVPFSTVDLDSAIAIGNQPCDGVVFEMEHGPYDIKALRDCLQYMLNRNQILQRGNVSPSVTPLVRIPPNGGELNQWIAKQVLDVGVYGVVWPHVSTVEDARNAVAACRYPRPKDKPNYEPAGQRGDAPFAAARYWGITPQEYYARADVWPLNPQGEILVVIMCEEVRAIENLPDMLKQVPGIGVVLIGEGDLSQDLGHPRDYEHPAVIEAMAEIRKICNEHNVPVGHPHIDAQNIEQHIGEGYRFLMAGPTRSFAALQKGRELTGRA